MTTDVVKQIRRATRRRFTAEEKIHIVLEGLRGEIPVTELCRKEGDLPPRTSPPSKLDSEPFEVHSTG